MLIISTLAMSISISIVGSPIGNHHNLIDYKFVMQGKTPDWWSLGIRKLKYNKENISSPQKDTNRGFYENLTNDLPNGKDYK